MKIISILSPLIPICLGLRQKSNLLWKLSLISLIVDITALLLKYYIDDKLSIAGNLFAIAELSCILLFYKRNKVFASNTLFYLLLSGGISYFILLTSFSTGWFVLNRFGISTFLILYIVLAITGFYKIIQQQKILFLERSSFFWANVAILIYASGAFFLFLSTSHIRNSADRVMLSQLWNTLFLSLNILKNILLGIALSKKPDT